MNEKELLQSVRTNPRKMRKSYLDESGVSDIISSHCEDDSFSQFNNRDKIDFVLNGCIDKFCQYCKINRAKVGNTFCSAKCTGKGTDNSQAQRDNAHERIAKSKATMLRKYGVAHNNHLPHCIESRKEKRLEWSIATRRETFTKYGLNVDQFSVDYVTEIFNKCFTLEELSINYFGGMPVMTMYRFIDHLGLDLRYERTSSAGEREVADFIESIGLTITKNDRSVIPPSSNHKNNLEIDIFVPEKNLAIEYHGLWCHIGEGSKQTHLYKHEYLASIGIDLIQIFEDEWSSKKDILKGIIKSRLGIFDKTYHARKLKISSVDTKQSRKFLEAHHMQGYVPGEAIGLFDGDQLLSLVSVGKTRFKNKEANWELLRYATLPGTRIIGGFKRLLSNAKRAITNSGGMISYCDRRLFSGQVYERNGKFIRNNPQGYYWVDPGKMIRLSRYKTQKHKLANLLGTRFDPSKTEFENMNDAGYTQIWDCGQGVYLL